MSRDGCLQLSHERVHVRDGGIRSAGVDVLLGVGHVDLELCPNALAHEGRRRNFVPEPIELRIEAGVRAGRRRTGWRLRRDARRGAHGWRLYRDDWFGRNRGY